jgi:hypothetical protein
MQLALLTALALLSTATAAPTATTDYKSLADRLIKLLKNPAAYVGTKPDACARISTGKYWTCGLGDYLPDGGVVKYTAADMSAIVSAAKAIQQTDVDMTKIKVTSEYINWGSVRLSRGSYELHGVFKRARTYNVYIGNECLAAGNPQFPDKLKDMPLGKFVTSPKASRNEYSKAYHEAWVANYDLPCVKVFVTGEAGSSEDPDFGQEEANAQLAGAATF